MRVLLRTYVIKIYILLTHLKLIWRLVRVVVQRAHIHFGEINLFSVNGSVYCFTLVHLVKRRYLVSFVLLLNVWQVLIVQLLRMDLNREALIVKGVSRR